MTHDEILDTIQRLLRLSESPNEHEARAAMAKAQEWMLRYNIAAEDLRAADAGAAGFTEEEVWERASVHPAWPPIFAVLARHFFVRVLTQRRRSEVHAPWRSVVTLFGTEANVAIASHVAVYLFRVFTALWKDEWWKWARRPSPKSFWWGMADGIIARLDAEREELLRATPAASNALVVMDAGLLAAFWKRYPDVKKRRERADLDEAYYAGLEKGRQVRIRRPIPSEHGLQALSAPNP